VGIVASLLLFFLGKGDLLTCLCILVWAGSVVGVRLFLGPSMQADVIDYDELYTGKRREAQYGALWALMAKFTMIPSASVPLAVLAVVGFEPNVQQTDAVKLALRVIYSFGPASMGILAFAIAVFFPIKEETHRRIIQGIEEHRRGEPALDPLTGRLVPPPSDRGVEEEAGWFLDHFSRRELERYLERGDGTLVRGALLGVALSLLVCALASTLVVVNLGDLSSRPGLTTVFEVVVAGFALTAVLYHAMRVRAARRMRRVPVPTDVVRAHIDVTWSLGSAPVAAARIAAAG
jgi:GPH family glycoside/pentoside/hexuronide:cation symporter